MRLLLGTALLILAVPAQAQTCDLSPTSPCAIPVDTDEEGLYFGDPATFTYNVTQGDSHVLEVWNWFEAAHVIQLEGHVDFEAAPFSDGPTTTSQVITFQDAGIYILRDATSGHEAIIQVTAGDVVDPQTGESSPTTQVDAPGLPFTLLVAAVLLMARQRR